MTPYFEPGGRWIFVMHGPDGHDYKNESTFAEMEPPRMIVIQHLSQPKYRLTIALAPAPTGTLVSWTQAFENARVGQRLERIVVPANEQKLDRLSAEVARANTAGPANRNVGIASGGI